MTLKERARALEKKLRDIYDCRPAVYLAAEALDDMVDALRAAVLEEREACAAVAAGLFDTAMDELGLDRVYSRPIREALRPLGQYVAATIRQREGAD